MYACIVCMYVYYIPALLLPPKLKPSTLLVNKYTEQIKPNQVKKNPLAEINVSWKGPKLFVSKISPKVHQTIITIENNLNPFSKSIDCACGNKSL